MDEIFQQNIIQMFGVSLDSPLDPSSPNLGERRSVQLKPTSQLRKHRLLPLTRHVLKPVDTHDESASTSR